MKSTKMTLIAALAVGSLLTLSPALRADDSSTNTPPSTPPAGGPSHGDRGAMRGRGQNFDALAERLNLTDDQKPKVRDILQAEREQMRDLWQNQDLSREDRMAKMKTIHDDTSAKLKNVLTPDQFQKWQEMGPMMGGPRHRPRGDGSNQGETNAPAGTPPGS